MSFGASRRFVPSAHTTQNVGPDKYNTRISDFTNLNRNYVGYKKKTKRVKGITRPASANIFRKIHDIHTSYITPDGRDAVWNIKKQYKTITPILKRNTAIRPLSGTAATALRRPYISKHLSAMERAGSETPCPHYYSKEFVEVQNKSKRYLKKVKLRKDSYKNFILNAGKNEKQLKINDTDKDKMRDANKKMNIDMEKIETRIKINIFGKERYKLKTERRGPNVSLEESLERNMMLTSRGSRLFRKRRPKSAFPASSTPKKKAPFDNMRPKTAPLQRHSSNNNNKMKNSRSTAVIVNSTAQYASNTPKDENSKPTHRKIFEKYVAVVPTERKRKNPNHATYITGSPIRIHKGISPSKLALMRVRKKLAVGQKDEAFMGNKSRYRNSNKVVRTSPLLKKKTMRPKSALPIRKLFTPSSSRSSSKFGKRPQSALPKTGHERLVSSLTVSETTALEDEYLVNAFDEKEEETQKMNEAYEGKEVAEKRGEEEEEEMFLSDDDEAEKFNDSVCIDNGNLNTLEIVKRVDKDEIERVEEELKLKEAETKNENRGRETSLLKLKKILLPVT